MKKLEDELNIHALKRQGLSQRAIARKLGIHRQTVKKYLEHPELNQGGYQRLSRVSKLDPYRDHIRFLPARVSWFRTRVFYTALRQDQ